MADDYRQRIGVSLAEHFMDGTDAMDNDACVCGGWADGDSGPDWDQHMADVVAAVRDDELQQLREANADLIRCAGQAARARLLHPTPAELVATHAQSDTLCTTCISPAPCRTRRALDGED